MPEATDQPAKPAFVYVTYIRATAEQVWQALTEGEITRQFWGGQANVSDWQPGSPWRHQLYGDPSVVDGVGTVVETDRPRRLVVTWAAPDDADDPAKHARVSFDTVEDGGVVRLTIMDDSVDAGSAEAWAMIAAGLKSLLETGAALPPFWSRQGNIWTKLRFA